MNRIRVALFENRTQAEPARQRLAQEGIRAETKAELGLARLWFISRWRAGMRLEVPAIDAERAGRLLREWSAEPRLLEHAIRCPECKSFRVDYPQFTEKSLFTNLAMGLVAGLGLIERQYYCEECHCMWLKPGGRTPRIRSHMGPDYFLERFSLKRQAPVQPSPSGAAGHLGPEIQGWKKRSACRASSRFNRHKSTWTALGIALPLSALLLLAASHAPVLAAEIPSRPTRFQGVPAEASTSRFAIRPERSALAAASGPTYLRDVLPILMGKCARCHNGQSKILANWLDYDTAASKRWEIKRRVWDSWHGSYFKQPMPTPNGPEAAAITEDERQEIKDWVEGGAPRGLAPIYSSQLSKSEKIELGKRLFTTICAACHQPTGQGIPGRFPPLAGSDFLNSDKHRAIKIVVNGLQGEVLVNGQKFNNAMPQFPLTDQDIASALTYVYNSFGNSGKEVSPEEVSAVRSEMPEPGAAPLSTPKVPEEKSPFE